VVRTESSDDLETAPHAGALDICEIAGSLRRALATFDPALLSASDCVLVAEELTASAKACTAASLLAASRAAQSGAHRDRGFREAASWIAHEAGSTARQAKDALETARSLDRCPRTREALLAGDVSMSQAHEIAKAEQERPGAEADLLEVARNGNLTQLRDQARERRLKSVSPDVLRRRQLAARRFRWWRDGLGMLCFDGALPPDVGLPFLNRLEHLAQRLRRDASARGGTAEPFERYASDAFAALTRGGEPGVRSDSTRTELVIVCDLRAWRRGHAHATEPCHLIGGGPIPVEIAKQLATDAFVKGVLHDGVEIRTVRHFGRRMKAELKTALDLGPAPAFTGPACIDCGWSGHGVQYDHLDPVANGGLTTFKNLVARCRPDHEAKTERDREEGRLGKRPRSPKDRLTARRDTGPP